MVRSAMAHSYASLIFKNRTKDIFLWKDDDNVYRWYDLNGKKIRRIPDADNIADAKINAWEVYGEVFQVDSTCENSLDKTG